MGTRLYPLPDGDETKVWYSLGLGMGMGINFWCGDEYGIAKLVPAPPRCHPYLGEFLQLSPGREHQFAISCFTWQRHTHIPNDNQFILISRQAFFKHNNHKTEVKQPTYDKKRRTLASLTWNELVQGLDTNSGASQLKEQT